MYAVYEDDPYVVACARALHHCEIVIDGDTLTLTAVNAENKEIIDSFTLVGATDEDAPTPNPMEWAMVPTADTTSIAMVAAEATDPSGVEYYFTCAAGGGHDSGWQDSTEYTDTDIAPGATYTYTVKARDKSLNRNETDASSEASATLDADIVNIIKAEYSASKEELKVEATSNVGGDVILTVVGYGDMTYSSTTDKHKYSGKPVADPGETVIVRSTGGGQDTEKVRPKN